MSAHALEQNAGSQPDNMEIWRLIKVVQDTALRLEVCAEAAHRILSKPELEDVFVEEVILLTFEFMKTVGYKCLGLDTGNKYKNYLATHQMQVIDTHSRDLCNIIETLIKISQS